MTLNAVLTLAFLATASSLQADMLTLISESNAPKLLNLEIAWLATPSSPTGASLSDTGDWNWSFSLTPGTDPTFGPGMTTNGSVQRIIPGPLGGVMHSTPFVPYSTPIGTYVMVSTSGVDVSTATLQWNGPNTTSLVFVTAVQTPEPATGALVLMALIAGAILPLRRRRAA
jgi:hypothetical protein